MREDLVFKSKEQAVRLQIVFRERYGEVDGEKRYQEVLKRSVPLDKLPERLEKPTKISKRKINVTTRFGRAWRGV